MFLFIIRLNTERGYKLGQLSFEGEILRNEMGGKGYALVQHGLEDGTNELIQAYARFTDNLPEPELETMSLMISDVTKLDELDYSMDKQVEWHKYRTNHPQFAKPGGYTNRSLQIAALREFDRDTTLDGKVIQDDPKEYYHYHPNSMADISRQHGKFGWGGLPSELFALNLRFSAVHKLAREAITSTLSLIEEDHPELTSLYARPRDLDISPLRLVFYHKDQGEVLAERHLDKSSLTMQLAESHMGLRAWNPQTNKMETVRRPAGSGVVFPGVLWNQMYSGSEFSPTWHDVINLEEPNEGQILRGQNCARWALIWFTNVEILDIPQKSDTHIDRTKLVAVNA
jgi:hypothetical protein